MTQCASQVTPPSIPKQLAITGSRSHTLLTRPRQTSVFISPDDSEGQQQTHFLLETHCNFHQVWMLITSLDNSPSRWNPIDTHFRVRVTEQVYAFGLREGHRSEIH